MIASFRSQPLNNERTVESSGCGSLGYAQPGPGRPLWRLIVGEPRLYTVCFDRFAGV